MADLSLEQQKALALASARKRKTENTENPSTEGFFDVMGRRASNAWNSRPKDPGVPKTPGEFLDQVKEIVPNTEKAMGAGFGVVSSPLGAAGENLEYRAAKAAGVPDDKAIPLAKNTGDVSEALLGVMPGIKKVPKAITATADSALGAVGTGLGKARESVNAVSDKMAVKPDTHADLKAEANALYDQAEKASQHTFDPKFSDEWADELEKLKPQTEEGKAFTGDTPFTELVKRANDLRGKSISLRGAQEIDEALGDEISSHFVNGKLDKQGQKIWEAQDRFREMMAKEPGGEILKRAREKWSQAAKYRDIEKLVTRAQQTDNPAGAIKTAMRTLYNSDSRMRGFSAEEKEAIRKIAEGSPIVDMLRTGSSKLLSIIHAATGGGVGGSALTYAGSRLAGNAAEAIQMRKVQKVKDLITKQKANSAIGAAP